MAHRGVHIWSPKAADIEIFHPALAGNVLRSAQTLGDLTALLALMTNLGTPLGFRVSLNTNWSFK